MGDLARHYALVSSQWHFVIYSVSILSVFAWNTEPVQNKSHSTNC